LDFARKTFELCPTNSAVNYFLAWPPPPPQAGDGVPPQAEKACARKGLQVRFLSPPPIFRIRILGDYCLAPPEAGLGFGKDFEGVFEVAKQFLPAQTEVRTNLF